MGSKEKWMKQSTLALLLLASTVLAAPREVQMYSKKLDYDAKRKKVRLIGDVKITSAPYVMTSPYAEFFTESKIGEFQGGVKIVGEGSTLTGKRMKVFYTDQKATLVGDVRLITDKGPGGAPTTMTGDELVYEWAKGYGAVKGHVLVVQEGKQAFADEAIYYRDRKMVYLEGNVRVERGDGDWLTAQRARMNLETNLVEADGGVTARTLMEEAEKPQPETTASPSPAEAKPLEPPFPIAIPTAAPPPRLPGVDQ